MGLKKQREKEKATSDFSGWLFSSSDNLPNFLVPSESGKCLVLLSPPEERDEPPAVELSRVLDKGRFERVWIKRVLWITGRDRQRFFDYFFRGSGRVKNVGFIDRCFWV